MPCKYMHIYLVFVQHINIIFTRYDTNENQHIMLNHFKLEFRGFLLFSKGWLSAYPVIHLPGRELHVHFN